MFRQLLQLRNCRGMFLCDGVLILLAGVFAVVRVVVCCSGKKKTP